MSDRYASRRDALLAALRQTEADALLVTDERNVRYLTGFTGDATYLFLSPTATRLVSDSRFETQIAEECPGLDAHVRTQRTKMVEAVAEVVGGSHARRVGFEADSLGFAAWESLRDALKTTELTALAGTVERLRAVKDDAEVAAIRAAVRMAEEAFTAVTAALSPEMTETEVARALHVALWRAGASGPAFESIVAVGDRAALPHYRPGKRRLAEDALLLIDWGAAGPDGYHSDLTRTIATAGVTLKFSEVHAIVDRARRAAIDRIRPGVKAADVDAAARGVIEAAGYGGNFGHGLGHGIGLAVHEAARFSGISTDVLEAGMVMTVEPGIYLPGWGGVRIEDDVLVTSDGCEVLSTLPRALEESA